MNNKVSVIIPNYNANEYILKCIESVIKQTYKDIEIIVIDDGSTDKSWETMQEINKKYENIIMFRQYNMNAAIARNKGIDLASGKYILFLDSDDELFESAIEIMVNQIERVDADIAIGNFVSINENNLIIESHKIIKEDSVCENVFDYVDTVPNPSNKLFKLDIIKKNNIFFGNVRIGQDLNFFLKYISVCNKIALLNYDIYMWRRLEFSMSNTNNLRIFDITESFNDVKRFYLNFNKEYIYEKYIKMIEFRHYYLQMEKQKKFDKRSTRKLIINFFKIKLNNINVKECIIFEKYKNDYLKCKIKLYFSELYATRLYSFLDRKYCRKR